MNAPRNILYVLEATQGGTRKHLRDLACALDRSRFHVTVAVSCLRDPAFEEEDKGVYAAAGIDWVEVPMQRAVRPLADFAACWNLRRLARRLQPDIVHAHSSKAGALARFACRGLFPVVYTPHVFPFFMQGALRLYKEFERRAVPWTEAVICVTEEERLAALGLGYAPKKVFLIRNGIRAENLCPAEPAAKEEENSVGFFGRDARQKGGDILRGCKGVDIRFSMDYPQREAVPMMQKPGVIAMPSRWEGCPYELLEAWARGTPVVASGVGGLAEMIQDGVNGVLLAPDAGADDWARTLKALLADRPRRAALAAGGRKSLAQYPLDKMVSETVSVYETVKKC